MLNSLGSEFSHSNLTPKYQKKPYTQPQLQLYGTVCALTQSGTLNAAEGSGNGSNVGSGFMAASDRSLKTDVVRIGNHPFGFGLYLFNFKPQYRGAWGHARQFGVMADEVEKTIPKAISTHPHGYKLVNYSLLGINRNIH
jgi:hypothetical protein